MPVFPHTGMDTLHHGGTGRSMQSRLCWKIAGISWEKEEPFVTNYANALCINVSPTSPSMSRLISDIPISLLFSYFSIVDFSTGIKMELFSFEGTGAKSWLNHGKLENQNKLLYFHSWVWWVPRRWWGWQDKVWKWWWSMSTYSSECQVLGKTYLSVVASPKSEQLLRFKRFNLLGIAWPSSAPAARYRSETVSRADHHSHTLQMLWGGGLPTERGWGEGVLRSKKR